MDASTMKLISLHEPWATLMALGEKRVETRSWKTNYRGWIAIHSSAGGLSKTDLYMQCRNDPFFNAALSPLFPDYISCVLTRRSWSHL